ncbi:hypothetical protein OB920_13345 [Halobacteria archaeon HArc-gm2]|nr:hypothetical protein [Halobacteria archaeon HArc-gm2]
MASESREDPVVGVDVPDELDEWLDEQAATLGLDREQLVAQILASYHAAATLDGDLDATELLDLDADDFVDVESAVAEAVEQQVDSRLDDVVESHVEAALDDRLDDRLDDLDAEFQAKIDDVRERVVQVKQETDAKAPKAHTHDELAAVDALDARVNELATDLARLREDVDDRLDDVEDGIEAQADAAGELTDRVDDAAEKLNRVAWVVSDLKEETAGRDAHEKAVDRIRRAAAQEGVSTATCERCGEAVHVALLNEPECPHCQATVSDVRPAGGILRKKARLVPAAQLEAGEGHDE